MTRTALAVACSEYDYQNQEYSRVGQNTIRTTLGTDLSYVPTQHPPTSDKILQD